MSAIRAWTGVTAVGLILAMAGCGRPVDGGRPDPVTEVRIGVLAPLSGTGTSQGLDLLQGAQLAADLVNEEYPTVPLPLAAGAGIPGLGGARITVVPADTRGRSDTAAAVAAKLVDQPHLAGVVGAYDTEATATASQVTERVHVPFVDGNSSADYLTEQGLDWFFRIGPTDHMVSEALAGVLGQRSGGTAGRRAVILHVGDTAGNSTAETISRTVGHHGYGDVTRVSFAPGTRDLQPQVRQVRAAGPDTVFLVASSSAEALGIIDAISALRYRPPTVMSLGRGFSEPEVVGAGSRAGVDLFYGSGWSRDFAVRNAAARAVDAKFAEKFDRPMNQVAIGGFNAVLTLAMAVDKARSTEPEEVRSALLGLDLPARDVITPWHGVHFDTTHQNVRAAAVVERFAGSGLRLVFPRDLLPAGPPRSSGSGSSGSGSSTATRPAS